MYIYHHQLMVFGYYTSMSHNDTTNIKFKYHIE